MLLRANVNCLQTLTRFEQNPPCFSQDTKVLLNDKLCWHESDEFCRIKVPLPRGMSLLPACQGASEAKSLYFYWLIHIHHLTHAGLFTGYLNLKDAEEKLHLVTPLVTGDRSHCYIIFILKLRHVASSKIQLQNKSKTNSHKQAVCVFFFFCLIRWSKGFQHKNVV